MVRWSQRHHRGGRERRRPAARLVPRASSPPRQNAEVRGWPARQGLSRGCDRDQHKVAAGGGDAAAGGRGGACGSRGCGGQKGRRRRRRRRWRRRRGGPMLLALLRSATHLAATCGRLVRRKASARRVRARIAGHKRGGARQATPRRGGVCSGGWADSAQRGDSRVGRPALL